MATKTDRIRFVCEHCDYRARIPAKYDGQTIACPNCKKPSVAKADAGPATGGTVEIRKGDAQPAPDDKFRFVCGDCGYRARIPVKYAGMAIKCPGCGVPQEANQEEEAEHTGGTVEIRKVDLTGAGERFLFQCGGCGYRARLPSKYNGQDIKCPGCGTPQTAEPVTNPGPSTGSTVNISKVEAASMTDDEPSPGGGLSLDEPSGAIDLDAPGDDQVEVPVAAPVATATPVGPEAPAKRTASSSDLPVPTEEVADDPAAPAQPPEYDPFGDKAKEEAAAAAPPSEENQELLGELRKTSDRHKVASPADDADVGNDDEAADAPAPAAPAAKARRGSERAPAAAGGGSKGPVMALGVLLAIAVIAAGALGYLFSQKSAALATEQGEHSATKAALSDEQAAHETTQGRLTNEQEAHTATQGELGQARSRIEELDAELLDTTAQLNVTKDQLATAKQQAVDLRNQVDQAVLDKRSIERQLETLQAQMQQVDDAMEKSGHEELEAFLRDALKRR